MRAKTTNRKKGRRALPLLGCFRRLRRSHDGGGDEGAEKGCRGLLREEGANLVEMALCCAIYFAMLFGIIEFSWAIYSYTFISEAAREASRYASVRGALSCIPNTLFPNCNLNPVTTGDPATDWTSNTSTDPVLAFVKTLGYPGLSAGNLTVTTTWHSLGETTPETWSTSACTTSSCNSEGNAVEVLVTYAFPLNIPFWKNGTLHFQSRSQMVIGL